METGTEIADPTHSNLIYALLDQKMAGRYRGLRYAYHPVVSDRSEAKCFGVGIAVASKPGYERVTGPDLTWNDWVEADKFCEGMNHHIGLSRSESTAIVVSSMRAKVVSPVPHRIF